MARSRPVLTAEHHAEGIVEFHSTCQEPPMTLFTLCSLLQKTGAVALLACVSGLAATRFGPVCDFLGFWMAISALVLWRRSGRVWQESLLVVHDLGVQTRRKYYSGKEDCRFVERGRIQEVIINEGVGYAAVTYYIAVITSDDPEMMLAFRDMIPALNDLLHVYHCIRSVIFGEDLSDKSLPPPVASLQPQERAASFLT
jgi:hypothetical protein